MEPSSPLESGLRKRVCKACDRCRLKKSKCDGASPCSRCKADNAICVFGERKKSHDKVYPKGYVEMLENQQAQLVAGLQEMYRRTQAGQGWAGAPLKETGHGMPLTHDILERLGALKQEGHASSETFEDDLGVLQQRLLANGASLMQREPSFDTISDAEHSPIPEPIHQKPVFSNPFPTSQFPPTPPNQSPYPHMARAVPHVKSQTYPRVTMNQSNLSWTTPVSQFDDGMDYMDDYDPPMIDTNMDLNVYPTQAFPDHFAPTAINPCLTMKNWVGQDDGHRYYSPAML